MPTKLLFSSTGAIKALTETVRSRKKTERAITSFGPELKKGERFDSVVVDKSMRKELKALELNKYKVTTRDSRFVLSEKPTRKKKTNTKCR